MPSTIIPILKQIIADELDVDIKIADIGNEMPLLEDGIGLDSVAVMEFIVLIEKKFDFKFSDDELTFEPFTDLNTLADFIAKK
ncbi:MAG: acyl carrier protein [Methylococcales bacterium]|nr:acyl carrier protein [Methylococcales bacterium]